MIAADLVSRIMQIVLINLVLSGDNAVVIGMAAYPLGRHERRVAIVVGGGAAILLRIALTWSAAVLLEIPALRAVGGLVLLWVGFRLLEVSEAAEEHKQATTLLGAIGTILLADVIMSLDNVLGVAAVSHGEVILLAFGLIVSMAVLMVAGGLIAELIDRLWWLAYLGAALIAWTGSDMIQDDIVVAQVLTLPDVGRVALDAVVAVALVVVAHRVHRQTAPPSSCHSELASDLGRAHVIPSLRGISAARCHPE